MKICVFGLWHLGSVTAACLSKLGHSVIGLDFDKTNIDNLNLGIAQISEPGLNELILDGIKKQTLEFTLDQELAIKDSDVLWITFDTPVDENDNADFGYIEKSFLSISGYLKDQAQVIISSQVPVGFTKHICEKYKEIYPGKKIYFAYSPENLRLGKALKVFLDPDRIIIGTAPEEKSAFQPIFSSISENLEWMRIESAEMTKHAINSFLATSICFANEVATLCEYMGADAREVERGLKTEERIGPKAYLTPGNAFSGGTLARDVLFLQHLGKEKHLPIPLLSSLLKSNDFHKTWIRRKCKESLGNLKGKNISVLGLTYKPGTDTLRRSLSVELCKWLYDEGAIVNAFDPAILSLPPELSQIINLYPDIDSAINDADCVIIATEWTEFQNINENIISKMRKKIIIDPNGFLKNNLRNTEGIRLLSVGRDI